MKAILVDDEENNIRNLEALLAKFCPQVEIISKCYNAFDAKNKIELMKPDLVFLDINMPKVNGLELLKMYINELGDRVKTIIITAHEEYALEALKTGALAYILKPIDKTDLINAVKSAGEYFRIKLSDNKEAENKHQANDEPSADSKIIVNSEQGYVVLLHEDIIKIEAVNTYSRFFDVNNKEYLNSKPLKFYEETLPKNKFMRIHKSFIINLAHVVRIGKSDDSKTVYLSKNIQAIVAKDKKVLLKKALSN